jgi:hypothetical protein
MVTSLAVSETSMRSSRSQSLDPTATISVRLWSLIAVTAQSCGVSVQAAQSEYAETASVRPANTSHDFDPADIRWAGLDDVREFMSLPVLDARATGRPGC